MIGKQRMPVRGDRRLAHAALRLAILTYRQRSSRSSTAP
jgi:hypothetical protein